jgi:hypothetical protein
LNFVGKKYVVFSDLFLKEKTNPRLSLMIKIDINIKILII